jgi:hypothetical protein
VDHFVYENFSISKTFEKKLENVPRSDELSRILENLLQIAIGRSKDVHSFQNNLNSMLRARIDGELVSSILSSGIIGGTNKSLDQIISVILPQTIIKPTNKIQRFEQKDKTGRISQLTTFWHDYFIKTMISSRSEVQFEEGYITSQSRVQMRRTFSNVNDSDSDLFSQLLSGHQSMFWNTQQYETSGEEIWVGNRSGKLFIQRDPSQDSSRVIIERDLLAEMKASSVETLMKIPPGSILLYKSAERSVYSDSGELYVCNYIREKENVEMRYKPSFRKTLKEHSVNLDWNFFNLSVECNYALNLTQVEPKKPDVQKIFRDFTHRRVVPLRSKVARKSKRREMLYEIIDDESVRFRGKRGPCRYGVSQHSSKATTVSDFVDFQMNLEGMDLNPASNSAEESVPSSPVVSAPKVKAGRSEKKHGFWDDPIVFKKTAVAIDSESESKTPIPNEKKDDADELIPDNDDWEDVDQAPINYDAQIFGLIRLMQVACYDGQKKLSSSQIVTAVAELISFSKAVEEYISEEKVSKEERETHKRISDVAFMSGFKLSQCIVGVHSVTRSESVGNKVREFFGYEPITMPIETQEEARFADDDIF